MNKAEFLNNLGNYLSKMDEAEINKFINYYDEMISDYMENGLTENEAIDKIGNPQKVAKELLENYDVKINLPSTGYKSWNIILLILGFPLWGSLLLAFVLLIISAYVIIWCIPFTTGVSSVGLLASSIIGILGTPLVLIHNTATGMIQLGAAVASIGLAFLLGFATIDFSKKLIIVTKNFNVKLGALLKKVVKK